MSNLPMEDGVYTVILSDGSMVDVTVTVVHTDDKTGVPCLEIDCGGILIDSSDIIEWR